MLIRHIPSNTEMVYVMLDLAFASENIRKAILTRIWKDDPNFRSDQLILTATHTHSAPAGFTNYMGYEVATPGYRPDIVENIGQRTYEAIQDAIENIQPVHLQFSERFVPYDIPIAFSRNALDGYNSNPEVTEKIFPDNNYVATDRTWQLIQFDKPGDDRLHSVLNFFGSHPNRMGPSVISSDTRGAACDSMEKYLPDNGMAIFAQNAPGDIDSEGSYWHQTDTSNHFTHPPAYSYLDVNGTRKKYPRGQRVLIEGQILMDQSFETIQAPDETFEVSGPIDCELIYLNMNGQSAPKGKYPETLSPMDYYKNTYYLLGGFGRFGSLFKPDLRFTHTSPPTIGMGAIARVNDRMLRLMTNLELTVRYLRLFFSGFDSEGSDNAKYVWNMYRAQADKTVMLEGGPISSALGFRVGGLMFNAFAGQTPYFLNWQEIRKLVFMMSIRCTR